MVKGVIAGNFDVIHPGYIKMFKECRENSDLFIVLLHDDPSFERPEKLKPVLSLDDRVEILSSIRYIDEIRTYQTEKDLYKLLIDIKPDVRFLGDDYKGKTFTGGDLDIKIHYLDRSHGWSTTKYKNLIAKTIQ
jgi:glycerol-3-phosphate cytidylyltransferase